MAMRFTPTRDNYYQVRGLPRGEAAQFSSEMDHAGVHSVLQDDEVFEAARYLAELNTQEVFLTQAALVAAAYKAGFRSR